MIVIDEYLLASIRLEPCCWCDLPGPSEASHTFAKGMGGAFRLDVVENVLPVCRECHQAHHDGSKSPRNGLRLGRYAMLCLSAVRIGISADECQQRIFTMRNAPKEQSYRVSKAGRKLPLRSDEWPADHIPLEFPDTAAFGWDDGDRVEEGEWAAI